MKGWLALAALAALLSTSTARGGEFRVSLVEGQLLVYGTALQVGYRPEGSHWQYGFRYARWTDTFEDPFSGNKLTDNTYTLLGPTLCYLFDIESPGTWYLGVFLLKWSDREYAYFTGESDTAGETAPFFGGGYQRRIGEHFYWNLGMFLSGLTARTETSVSSTEESVFDAQAQLGIVF